VEGFPLVAAVLFTKERDDAAATLVTLRVSTRRTRRRTVCTIG
jgi:hypothetical protein